MSKLQMGRYTAVLIGSSGASKASSTTWPVMRETATNYINMV